MQILIHADARIDVSPDLVRASEERLDEQLGRFASRIMRVDVHLADVTGTRFEENDKECTLSLRISKRSPVTVSDRAPSSALAVEGAAHKATRLLDATFEREGGHPGTETIRKMRADKGLA